MKWKHFPRNWPFVRGIHRSPVNSPHKCQWRGAMMFSLICVWISDWVNYREAGNLRRYRAHYDVIAMFHVHQHATKPLENAMLKSVYFYGNSSGEIDRVVACHTLWKHNLINRLRGFGIYHELVSQVFQVLKRQPTITIMLRLMCHMQNRSAWHWDNIKAVSKTNLWHSDAI